jgi:hypothetical protein
VTVPVAGVPVDVLHDWIEESYRLVAPKRLVARLDERLCEERAEVARSGGDDA